MLTGTLLYQIAARIPIGMKAGSSLQYHKAGRNSFVSESWKNIY
jgi:hypothetical protein